jgi:NADH:ubiquinone oxidoreductase subunit 2 (subunit N)
MILMRLNLNLTNYVIRLLIFSLFLVVMKNLSEVSNLMSDREIYLFHSVDFFNICFSTILLVITIFCLGLLFIANDPSPKNIQPAISVIILIFLYGYTTAVEAENFFFLYLVLEASAFSAYCLIALNSMKLISIEGSIKYFLGSSIASVCILLGISIVYSLTGTMNVGCVSNYFVSENSNLLLFAILLIVIGLLSKLAMAPLHWFTIDSYQSAPLFISSFLMTVPKVSLLLILSNIFYQFPSPVLNSCALILMLITGFQQTVQAFGQVKLRRFIVFTMTVNNVILLAPSFITTVENPFSILPSILSYFLPLLLLLYIFSLIMNSQEKVSSLSLLTNPFIILNFLISMISFIGIPLLGGFLMKYFILSHLLSFQELGLVFLIVTMTLLPVYYYLRIIQMLFFTKEFKQEVTYFALADKLARREQYQPFNQSFVAEVLCILLLLNVFVSVYEIQAVFFSYS